MKTRPEMGRWGDKPEEANGGEEPETRLRCSSRGSSSRREPGRLLSWNLRHVIEPPNYDSPHVPVIVIMTYDSRTYVPHNLKGLLSSEQDPITGVL
jgi:hypothetical protein